MTEFMMGEPFIGCKPVEISESKFSRVYDARNRLIALWEIEDNFQLLAESFVEFEKEVLGVGVDGYYSDSVKQLDAHSGETIRGKLNLKILTLLNAAKAYEDQAKSRVSELNVEHEGEKFNLNNEFSRVYDTSFEYRVGYCLRNYAQHKRLPLGGLTYSHTNIGESGLIFRADEPSRHRVTVELFLDLERLTTDSTLNAKVRREIKEYRKEFDKFDLKFFVEVSSLI